jgi:hypothetical protein
MYDALPKHKCNSSKKKLFIISNFFILALPTYRESLCQVNVTMCLFELKCRLCVGEQICFTHLRNTYDENVNVCNNVCRVIRIHEIVANPFQKKGGNYFQSVSMSVDLSTYNYM